MKAITKREVPQTKVRATGRTGRKFDPLPPYVIQEVDSEWLDINWGGGDRLRDLGLLVGDDLVLRETQLENLKPGHRVIVHDNYKAGIVGAGRFVRAGVSQVDIKVLGATFHYRRSKRFTYFRVEEVRPNARMVRAREQADRLLARLSRLGNDITDSTERFKIERELYDLIRETDGAAEEWPEVIGAAGGDLK
jgi:hypothetical protein